MKNPHFRPSGHRMRGLAAMEFAMVLPFLVVLLIMAVDLTRAIQAEIILLNISREGANLASRATSDLNGSSQTILNALAATTPPLDMNNRGMIYITKLMGPTKAGQPNIVLEQYRWSNGIKGSGYQPASKVWNCGGWDGNGTCTSITKGSGAPTAGLMQNQLADGELIYAVETFYKFDMIFGSLKIGTATTPIIGPNLYSMTVF